MTTRTTSTISRCRYRLLDLDAKAKDNKSHNPNSAPALAGGEALQVVAPWERGADTLGLGVAVG